MAAVVEGRVDRANGHIRANASLARVSDGKILWTGRFDRMNADIFAVQDEITAAIVDSLHVQRDGATRGPIVGQPTHDLVAYDLYLAGRRLAVTRRREALDSAKSLFLSATRLDKNFALAFSALADVYTVSIVFNYGPHQQNLDLGENAADRALELDSTLGEAHSSKGFVLMNRPGQLGAAEASFQKAMKLDPSYVWAHHYYSMLLAMEGREDEAERENRRSLKIDPLSAQANFAARDPPCHAGRQFPRLGSRSTGRWASIPDSRCRSTHSAIIDAAEGRYAEALVSSTRHVRAAPDSRGYDPRSPTPTRASDKPRTRTRCSKNCAPQVTPTKTVSRERWARR